LSLSSALAATVWGAACAGQDVVGPTAPAAPSAWLNVQDCGASGSPYESTATTVAGSNQITVKDVGDFRVGQGVTVSRCNIACQGATLWGPQGTYGTSRPLKDAVAIRGYDGSTRGWLVFILEVDNATPTTFRWTDDLARTWNRKGVPITYDWQPLSNGVEVKFAKQDWQPGHMVTFTQRDQLATRIEKIEGNTLTLAHPANRAAQDAVVRHSDRAAIQSAIDRAIQSRRNVFFPAGHYRIPGGLYVPSAAIQIEGANGTDTVLDISDGNGSCFSLQGGTEVTIRNFRMVGNTPQAEAAGSFRLTNGKGSFWACALKGCNAVTISATERVLVENVHASRMSSECFYCQAPSREGKTEPKFYTKNLTFLRCSVTDCAANGFNNNDTSENTSILYCRLDGAGWQAYEGPGRFIKIVGNYVRNGGNGMWVGSMNHRYDHLEELGCGQAIITDNVFEGIGKNRVGVWIARAASQVVIANNLFVNYNATAIDVSSVTDPGFPSNRVTVTGNIIDLTCVDGKPTARTGIRVSTPGTIVSDNQIYVRGAVDPLATGIALSEAAVDVDVHDNLIRGCGYGLRTDRIAGSITAVVDPHTFLCKGLPQEWRLSHQYRGWSLAWRGGNRANTISVIDSYDAKTLTFRLREPADLAVGTPFDAFPPSADWSVHNNTISGCTRPVTLDSYGGPTSACRDNTITRGEASGVKDAITVAGQFSLSGNVVSGFDEAGSAALSVKPDASGRLARGVYLRNTFERCAAVVREAQEGLWVKCLAEGNLFVNCGTAPATGGTTITREQTEPVLLPPPPKPALAAPKLAKPVALDGAGAEWPWQDPARTIALAQSPAGDPMPAQGHACAAWDETSLYLAIRIVLPKGAKAVGGAKWGAGDGVEVSFQDASGKTAGPIFLVWGDAAGRCESGPYGGASPAQVQTLEKSITYAAGIGTGEWTCEWRIPFAAAGVTPTPGQRLRLNVAVHQSASDLWAAWLATGEALYRVERAGELILGR